MTNKSNTATVSDSFGAVPITLPLSVDQFRVLVGRGDFDRVAGQVELMNGRIVQMNPQGPQHADPLDVLAEWSIEQSKRSFTIRIEKPIEIPDLESSPEPDIAWVDRKRYTDQHPQSTQVHLVMEASRSSLVYDSTEKLELYARAGIPEYWLVDLNSFHVIVHREPVANTYHHRQILVAGDFVSPLCLPTAKLSIAELFDGEPS